ncbi:MFS transporter [Pendulispora brunnea]|uniref:MFS transporter n=1 Tax=Pendulispora brunnea TaxID=2905690 RepID=A0ABZ2KD94_9BACT
MADPRLRARRIRVVIACGVGSFMAALSTNLVNISAPVIARELGLGPGEISPIFTVYLLVITVLLPVFGRVGDAFGAKKVFVAGFAGFGVTSLLCAHTHSLAALIAARALQGVCAAMLMSMGPAIVLSVFPPTHRARALGLQLSLTYLGLVIGPTLGGLLVGSLGWRSIFLVLCGVAVLGTVLATVWLVEGEVRRTRGAGQGTFSLPFWLGLAGALLLYTTTFMLSFSLPFQLQHARGISARDAGLLLTPQPAMMAIVAPIGGWLSDRFGTRWPCAFGMVAIAAGCVLLSYVAADASPVAVAPVVALIGLGAGAFVAPNNAAIMGAAPKDRQGTAAAAAAMARNIGMTSGVALAGALLHRAGSFTSVMFAAATLALSGTTLALVRPSSR